MSEAKTPEPDRVAYYARFLRGGGAVSLGDWRGMLNPEDRDALEAAGERIAGENAELVARALMSAPTVAAPPTDALERAAESALRGER